MDESDVEEASACDSIDRLEEDQPKFDSAAQIPDTKKNSNLFIMIRKELWSKPAIPDGFMNPGPGYEISLFSFWMQFA